MYSLNWQLRDCMVHLRPEGRLNVLVALVLHANLRGRCFPRMELIAEETGYALEAVNKAKKWLLAHGAIILVPYDKRVGKECELPKRQHIYQLTGALMVAGVSYEYLFMTDDDREEFNASIGEISTSEIMAIESKGSSSKQEVSSKQEPTADATAPQTAPPVAEVPASEPSTPPKTPTPHTLMKNAIVAAYGWEADSVTCWGEVNKASGLLRKAKATPDDIAGLHRWCSKKFEGKPFGPVSLAKWWPEYQKSNKARPPLITPGTVFVAPSLEPTVRRAPEGSAA